MPSSSYTIATLLMLSRTRLAKIADLGLAAAAPRGFLIRHDHRVLETRFTMGFIGHLDDDSRSPSAELAARRHFDCTQHAISGRA